MRQYSIHPVEVFASLWRNRELINASAKREVLGRYRGSVMGILWSFLNPLFLLAVYTFVFSEIFKARWNVESDSKTEFALVLFAGLLIFNLFAECINRAPGLILANPNYVKKVVFPLEILPVVVLLAGAFHALISLGVWMLAYLVFFGIPHATIVYLPFIVFPLMLFILGTSWALASLGVYLRDVGQFIGVITMVLMFMSPVFYQATSLPAAYRHFIYLNPLTPAIEQARDVLFWGKAPDLQMLGFCWMASLFIAWLGFAWFQKTRQGFADVI